MSDQTPGSVPPAPPGRPRRLPGPRLTIALLAVIALMFLWVEMHGGTGSRAALARWGALEPGGVIVDGQYWRLLTAVFLHQGYLHVGLNSLVLYRMGRLVEALFGHGRFAVIFLLSGLAGSLASLLQGPPLAGSVGASGAIFGLFGAMVVWRLVEPRARQVPWAELLYPIGINLMVGVLIPNVDQWAHLGGLLGGTAAGALVGLPGRIQGWRVLGVAAALAAAALLVAGRLPVAQHGARADLVRGLAALEQGRPDAAETYLRQAVAGRPRDADAHALLAWALAGQGQLAEADAAVRQALALDPANSLARELQRHLQAPPPVG